MDGEHRLSVLARQPCGGFCGTGSAAGRFLAGILQEKGKLGQFLSKLFLVVVQIVTKFVWLP